MNELLLNSSSGLYSRLFSSLISSILALMKEFTLEDLEEASTDEIQTVEGIGPELAERVKGFCLDGNVL